MACQEALNSESFREGVVESDGCFGIVFRDKLDNLFEISNGAARNQDFAVHRGIIAFTSSTGCTRPASTSFMPRCNAASSASSSGSAFVANLGSEKGLIMRTQICDS
jgi:hypothetical protein